MTWTPPGPAWLFCPADRPERYFKAAARADVVILDLEDAVAPSDKDAARQALVATPLDPERTVVRVNAHGSRDWSADLDALNDTPYRVVMLPKCESAEQVASLAPRDVVVLVESPLGVVNVADAVTADNAVGAMWGAEDLVAALGGNSSRFADGRYRDVARHVRSHTLLAAKARGLFALDSVFLDIPDLDGLREESDDAVAVGFDGKVAIHPSQVPVIRDAYAPSPEEVDWAQRLLEAVESNRGVFTFEGRMVDAPVIQQAHRIVARIRNA
ncbi:HpcH/HpaI aldolase/citrate lyase family protein [Rhodococcoides kyotonense]|uniref:Citrate lyase subunit beta / citryl-CoA lyase n=1 Tax=Rhodococcoides kyotonense TaxID=398843 RepID=A0A239MJX0_9NOCA|nr:CoA ester lyase [Rhodococcus kyotonensis]SNT42573.1 citrate lyase subunit beta / citryl-CoA lyase [Rhodococcus kyotonensis]